jgi:hypothetical protein
VWKLYRQCKQLETKLDELHVHARLVLARGHRQNGAIKRGSDTGAVEAEVMELRNRTDAAFKEALQLLKGLTWRQDQADQILKPAARQNWST